MLYSKLVKILLFKKSFPLCLIKKCSLLKLLILIKPQIVDNGNFLMIKREDVWACVQQWNAIQVHFARMGNALKSNVKIIAKLIKIVTKNKDVNKEYVGRAALWLDVFVEHNAFMDNASPLLNMKIPWRLAKPNRLNAKIQDQTNRHAQLCTILGPQIYLAV